MSETIINGIDVSGCPLYDKNTGCYHTFNGECVKDSCTVYKWLLEYKRLQKENEQLKKPCLVMPKVNQLAVPIEKYEQLYKALEEIREMLTECSTNANFLNNCSKSCKFYKNCNGELSVIQNKIDEVLNDNQ